MIDPEQLIARTFEIVPDVSGIDKNTALVTAHYMKKYEANTFDALHAAFCDCDEIISSDNIFDKVGLARIELDKQ